MKVVCEIGKDEIYDVSLHLWGQLLVETKLFDDQVMVILEGLLDRLANTKIQSGW